MPSQSLWKWYIYCLSIVVTVWSDGWCRCYALCAQVTVGDELKVVKQDQLIKSDPADYRLRRTIAIQRARGGSCGFTLQVCSSLLTYIISACSFTVTSPKIWNSLPPALCSCDCPDIFHWQLGPENWTHYFQQAFSSPLVPPSFHLRFSICWQCAHL